MNQSLAHDRLCFILHPSSFILRVSVAVWIAVVAPHVHGGDGGYLPGHSHLGEAFNRGPRQHAYLMGGTGKVHFPVSSKNPLVQKFVEQGVGQLHGFWYTEAERSFREAARLDPNCGIAYWGMSLANEEGSLARAKQFATEAQKHKAGLTEREKMYIDAIGKENGYKAIMAKYPEDVEAKAFEVWRVWHKSERVPAIGDQLETAMKLAQEILKVQPTHPINHAVIHIADVTKSRRRALATAARCGPAAPSIGHMWHMPTHIYYNLKEYPQAAWQLEASIRTEHARAIHDHVLPDQIHFYAHNNEWLVRTLLHLGRVHDARHVAMQMIELPRHPLFNTIVPPPDDSANDDANDDARKEQTTHEVRGSSSFYGRERLLQVLQRFECWDDLIELCKSGYIEMTGIPGEEARVRVALGVAHYSRGDIAAGNEELARLEKLKGDLADIREKGLAELASHPVRAQAAVQAAIETAYSRAAARITSNIQELENYRRMATGFFPNRQQLLVLLGILFVAEAAVFWFLRRRPMLSFPSIAIALAAGIWLFTRHLALIDLPYTAINVDFAHTTRALLNAGDFADAEWSARNYAKERPGQVRPQANLVEVLYKVGNTDAARSEFEDLRRLAGAADLDTPPLARLAPIAREFGFPTDWRLPAPIERQLAGRVPLSSLGPMLWHPWSAADWRLQDAQGRTRTLAEFHGKPVVLLFFLGRGCLHCKQQLEAFVKKASQLAKAGLTVIAISTDDAAGIKKSLSDFKPGPFPFLMLADPKLTAFRSYGAFDDFEQIALHATFVIDEGGRVRWQDVSFEPFMDVNFVMRESKRLLAQKLAPPEPDAHVVAEAATSPASAGDKGKSQK